MKIRNQWVGDGSFAGCSCYASVMQLCRAAHSVCKTQNLGRSSRHQFAKLITDVFVVKSLKCLAGSVAGSQQKDIKMNSSVITAITDHIFCHVWNLTGFRKLALITSSQVEEISAIGISRRVCEGQGCPGMHYLHTRCATLAAKCSNDSEWQKTSGLSLSYTLIYSHHSHDFDWLTQETPRHRHLRRCLWGACSSVQQRFLAAAPPTVPMSEKVPGSDSVEICEFVPNQFKLGRLVQRFSSNFECTNVVKLNIVLYCIGFSPQRLQQVSVSVLLECLSACFLPCLLTCFLCSISSKSRNGSSATYRRWVRPHQNLIKCIGYPSTNLVLATSGLPINTPFAEWFSMTNECDFDSRSIQKTSIASFKIVWQSMRSRMAGIFEETESLAREDKELTWNDEIILLNFCWFRSSKNWPRKVASTIDRVSAFEVKARRWRCS